jgi:hypothetical protein
MSDASLRVPRQHDRVIAQGQNGVYTIVDVDEKARTATLQTVTGDGPVIPNVPWAALGYMDAEDEKQVAARIIDEKAEGQ